MPYGKKRNYTAGKKSVKRRFRSKKSYGRRTNKKMAIIRPHWKNPLPTAGNYKFTYHDTGFALACNVGNGYQAARQWRGNSLFDPDYTGIGVQPYGYDNLCGSNCPFGKYTVYASKITVYPHVYTTDEQPVNGSGSWAIRTILYPANTNALTYNDYEDLCRMPYSKRRCIENSEDAGGNNIMKSYTSTRKMFPEAKGLQESSYTANYDATPAKVWYWTLLQDTGEFDMDCSIYYDVKITYYATLLKSNDVNES